MFPFILSLSTAKFFFVGLSLSSMFRFWIKYVLQKVFISILFRKICDFDRFFHFTNKVYCAVKLHEFEFVYIFQAAVFYSFC